MLTGLPNSGKEQIARALQVVLMQQGGRSVSLLNENNVSSDAEKLAWVSAELARAGAAVITSSSAPDEKGRAVAKTTVSTSGGAGNFFLIHVATPLEHCERTDRKGIYKKARAGELKGIPGVDVTYEAPLKADLTVDVTKMTYPEIVHSTWSFPLGV
jgi:sulfate adenylyltransferase